jgi:DHA2 family multidrug resistance protein
VVGLLVAAAICLTVFVIIELNHEEPLLDLTTLKSFPFTLSLVISTITTIAMMGAMFLIPMFMENLKGYSAMQTGMMMLPQAIVTGIMMPISGKLFDRYGAKGITIIGLTILTVCTYLLSKLTLDTSSSHIMFILALRGFGSGLCMMPIQTAGINTIPPKLMPKATALNSTIRQVAGSLGIAILATILQHRQTFHKVRFLENINTASPDLVKAMTGAQTALLQHGMSAANTKSAVMVQVLTSVIKQATVVAMNDTFLIAMLISAAGIPFALFIKKKNKNEATKTEHVDIEVAV